MTRRCAISLAALSAACAVLLAASAQKSTEARPVQAARLNNLGAAYMNQQLFEKALKAFQDAAALDPVFEIARLNQGIALLNLGKIDAARPLLKEAVKQNPNDGHAWSNLGLLFKNSGDAKMAIDAFRRVTEIDPNDADSWYFLGASYSENKRYPEAMAAFQHALKLNPQHASAEFGLSRAYQQSGDLSHAREHLVRFQYITQNKLGVPISLAYGEQGKYSLAEESLLAPEKVPEQIKVRFVDVTEEAGIVAKTGGNYGLTSHLGPGACFIDYDADGRVDIFLPANGPHGGLVLYHNLGNGKFEDVTKNAGLNPSLQATGCTVGDYDNDGFPDLAVTAVFVYLFHNDKKGKFVEVAGDPSVVGGAPASGITSNTNAGSSGMIWSGLNLVDYDHDGDLDLLATRYLETHVEGIGEPRVVASRSWRIVR
ncbi:MAG: tetratricopeptide repeat protein, partial [Terriglobales bacterium]